MKKSRSKKILRKKTLKKKYLLRKKQNKNLRKTKKYLNKKYKQKGGWEAGDFQRILSLLNAEGIKYDNNQTFKKVRQNAAMKYHPDKNGGTLESNELFKYINGFMEFLRTNPGQDDISEDVNFIDLYNYKLQQYGEAPYAEQQAAQEQEEQRRRQQQQEEQIRRQQEEQIRRQQQQEEQLRRQQQEEQLRRQQQQQYQSYQSDDEEPIVRTPNRVVVSMKDKDILGIPKLNKPTSEERRAENFARRQKAYNNDDDDEILLPNY